MSQKSKPYHHGDLRQSLLQEAAELLASAGIKDLSLRKLAERVGVSRTALYHHFSNKNDLLCALAEQGFIELEAIMADLASADLKNLSGAQKYTAFARRYINFATANPARYGLMFGSTLWSNQLANPSLKNVAFDSFKRQLDAVSQWQSDGILPVDQDCLRLTQVTWGTLHGLAQLVIDGVYAETSQLDAICQCVGELFTQGR